MLKKRGNRKSQLISTDFITAFTLYFLAFSIFSYFIFSIEGKAFTEASFLKDTHYNFDVFEENSRNAGLDFGSNYHLNKDVEDLKDFNYTTLREIAINGTQFERDIGSLDICIYLTDASENTFFHAGPKSGNVTLAGVPCGESVFVLSPFPGCGEAYDEGFSATKLYFYNETQRTARLVIHFCKK